MTTEAIAVARLAAVTGDNRSAADARTHALVDIDDYSGAVDLAHRATLGGECNITTVAGSIISDIPSVRPVAGAANSSHS